MKRDHTVLMPVLHYLPVLGGFEVFLKNIVERIGMHTDIIVITGRVAGVPTREQHTRATIIRKGSLYPLRDLSYSSYFYILSSMPVLLAYTLWYIFTKNVTLLHANGFFNGSICLAAHFLTGVPYVLTIQSADFTIYHEGVKIGLIIKAQDWFEKLVYRHASVCHAVSHDLCAHYKRQGVVSECIMIPNGVESELFKPLTSQQERDVVRERYGIPKDAFVVSNISRLEPKNGVRELIDAVGMLVAKYPNLLLLLIGDGSIRKELEQYVNEKQLEKNVMFTGQISYGDVGPRIASSDAFARTPRSEGFGIVFLEAMAAGVPVIGTRTGGIVDFITDGETGLFAEVGDVESIVRALERLIVDEALRSRLVKNAHQMVEEKYDWDRIAERVYEEVYCYHGYKHDKHDANYE